MHDRRVGGRVLTLGNQGALFMGAMTWWDHETASIWSQPWGAAIDGPLTGARLDLVPSEVRTLGSWTDRHGDTRVLVVGESGHAGLFEPVRMVDFFVIGVTLGDGASAYRYSDVAEARVINDRVGAEPIVVFAGPGAGGADVFLATPAGTGRALTFRHEDGLYVDEQTGSSWSPSSGLATGGPLAGERLVRIAYASAYDWAWEDFYPHSRLFDPSPVG